MRLSEYIGQEKAVTIAKNFMDSWKNNKPFAKCAIFHGPPGVGKSSLLPALALQYRTPLVRHNLSRDRGLADIRALKGSSTTMSLTGGVKLIFLDEADYMTESAAKEVVELIKGTKSPLVMACNYIDKIPLHIRKMCMEVPFEVPSPRELMKFAIELYADSDINIYQFRDIIVRCRSYRQVRHAIENGAPVYDADSFVEDEGSMTEALFRGVDLGLKAHVGERMLMWVRDNTTSPEVAESADMMFAMNRRVGRPIGEQACRVLSLATGNEARFPWSLKKSRAPPKKKTKAKTESKKLPTRGRGALKLSPTGKPLDSFF